MVRTDLRDIGIIFIYDPGGPANGVIGQGSVVSLLRVAGSHTVIMVSRTCVSFYVRRSAISLLTSCPRLTVLHALSGTFTLTNLQYNFALTGRRLVGMLLGIVTPCPIPIPITSVTARTLSRTKLTHVGCRVLSLDTGHTCLRTKLVMLGKIAIRRN